MYIKKIILIISLLGVVALGIFSYFIYDSIFSPNTKFTSATEEVFVETDEEYRDVIQQLRPLVKDIESFDAIARKKGYANNLKPGRFILKKGMNNNEMINTLRSQNQPVSLVFNNQERLEDLAGRIAMQIEADSLSLIETMKDSTFLAENNFKPETALAMYIPNQYQLYWNTSAEIFRNRMLKEYQRFWNEKRKAKAEKIDLTPNEVYTLAAIVQKETAKVDERRRVAGVYMNRYNRGIKLDADPTVIYAVKKKNNDFDTVIKRVLYKDLETDSPYNTYKYAGLPPGPIAMPDISAIDAVLNYEDHDYYYFVANPEKPGYHKFAKTLRQHNNNRQAYVRWINKMGINR
ncbi:endolytic transglycosylase MltG [Mesonia mobilis]|uniref:Endolytic murein transglycosylase n=1 Tax=Mesonia mobilis TaxID=369791 RepID=A0ABQ3BQC9_9FLAO|nr:endolytic transglycosylase MltG [Mesonia mobilis]MBQ0736773.1 endolytic transglycosylase MltG [Aquimarina celericrescens]GGZ50936.1 aminodeoxychorismate lyase [Mesonia mobilis]